MTSTDTAASTVAAPATPAPSVQSLVTSALNGLFASVVRDELGVLQPVGDSYLTSIISNPAPDNVVAQSLAFYAAVPAALPNMEAAAAKDAATSIKALIDTLAPSLVAQAATANLAG
jgi:hypothetical protein